MNGEILVYIFSMYGELKRLRRILDGRRTDQVKSFVSTHLDGATPLIIACLNGHFNVVTYLLQQCNADVEQISTYTVALGDSEKLQNELPKEGDCKIQNVQIRKATFSWYAFEAEAAGHLNIVKNLTPLRAACFAGRFEIAKNLIKNGAIIDNANEFGDTPLMIACLMGHENISRYLLECGANVRRKNVSGHEPLHACAKSGNLNILKMLLQHGAKLDTYQIGVTLLLTAATYGNEEIVDFIFEKHICTNQDKVYALELLGCSCIIKKTNMMQGFMFFRRAMEMRHVDTDFPLEKRHNAPISTYVDDREVRTLSELEQLIEHPDKMRTQALLVRERILGLSHPKTHYCIRKRGMEWADNGDVQSCIKLWMYALDAKQDPEILNRMTLDRISDFTSLFFKMVPESKEFNAEFPVISFHDILHVYKKCFNVIKIAITTFRSLQKEESLCVEFDRALNISMHLISLMCCFHVRLTKIEELFLLQAVHRLVDLNPRGRKGVTPLHIAYASYSLFDRYVQPTVQIQLVTNTLMKVGACTNARDLHNNTPLHIAATHHRDPAIIQSLVDHGAHLDLLNNENETPLQYIDGGIITMNYLNLKCLCAQSINTYKIPYTENSLLPRNLREFLDSHCSH